MTLCISLCTLLNTSQEVKAVMILPYVPNFSRIPSGQTHQNTYPNLKLLLAYGVNLTRLTGTPLLVQKRQHVWWSTLKKSPICTTPSVTLPRSHRHQRKRRAAFKNDSRNGCEIATHHLSLLPQPLKCNWGSVRLALRTKLMIMFWCLFNHASLHLAFSLLTCHFFSDCI